MGSIGRITPQGQTSFDLQILYQSRTATTPSSRRSASGTGVAVSQSGANTAYVGATADLYLADLRSGDYDVHSGLRTGFGGSALVGRQLRRQRLPGGALPCSSRASKAST